MEALHAAVLMCACDDGRSDEIRQIEVDGGFLMAFRVFVGEAHIRNVSGAIVAMQRYLNDGKYVEHRAQSTG